MVLKRARNRFVGRTTDSGCFVTADTKDGDCNKVLNEVLLRGNEF